LAGFDITRNQSNKKGSDVSIFDAAAEERNTLYCSEKQSICHKAEIYHIMPVTCKFYI
jgi:hypothetical protein